MLEDNSVEKVSKTQNVSNRIEWIVTLRAIAALAIVLLHVVSGWLDNYDGSLTIERILFDEVIVQVAVRWAVPCFVMISGVLFLDPSKQINVLNIKKSIFRMMKTLLTFGLGFCVIEVLVNGYRNPMDILFLSVKNLLEGKSWSHMWYVYMLIGLYMLTPLLREFIKTADSATLKYTLIILFIFGIVRPTINECLQIELAQIIPISTAYVFYYLVGYYIVNKKDKRKTIVFVGIAVFFILLLLKLAGIETSVDPDNLAVCLYSMGLFEVATDSKFLNMLSYNKIISYIAKYSFGIYILHPFFINVLYKMLNIYPDAMPVGVGELVVFIYALVCSYFTTYILCKFKIFKNILI